ncbi:MAG: DNA repair protein RecO [Parcubacteria group bacterium]|nr:DNA repair protein RecO [Parcubacteria group bacterium]
MATYKTQAIILSAYPYREHDRIISFFSDDFGRIEARARGVRKLQSKLAGHLEPFIKTELLLANGRKWDILAGSRTYDPRALIRSDIAKIAAASVCVEAVKRATRPLSRECGVYHLLDETLTRISYAPSGQESTATGQFVWHVLASTGFAPELAACINCKKKLSSGAFSCEGGGMLCSACASCDLFADAADESVLAELRGASQTFGSATQSIAKRFWNYVFEEPLESWNFYHMVAA